jgi:Protein of unknown function (DUF4058)
MPLRDHFRPPLDDQRSWDGLHGAWPAVMVMDLNRRLPPRYVAEPRVHLGSTFEIDVATSETEEPTSVGAAAGAAGGGAATAVWTAPAPTLAVATDLPGQDEYEVRVYDARRRRRLVAAVEIVSPSNKDRPEHRRSFVAKCAALLQQGVSIGVGDLVTTRQFNLYGDLLELIGQTDPSLAPEPPPLYAAACRWRPEHAGEASRGGPPWRLETWAHALVIGRPLPTLPLWLASDLAIPLELEATYEETCRILRIG